MAIECVCVYIGSEWEEGLLNRTLLLTWVIRRAGVPLAGLVLLTVNRGKALSATLWGFGNDEN